MKDWLHSIGEWVIINTNIEPDSAGDVGRLAYIKELLTRETYDYRVITDRNEFLNVKESEVSSIPKGKLEFYLKILNWKRTKYPEGGFSFKIHYKDFLNELLTVEDVAGDLNSIPFDGLVNGDEESGDEESGDVEMSEKEVAAVDNVNSPKHYNIGGIESIDYMKAKMSPEAFQGFLHGNVLKYISRSNYKNGIEDLEKAQWYLNRLVSEIKQS